MATGYNTPKLIDGQMHVWRQSWGWTQAKTAQELTVGDVLIFTGGYGSEITEIVKKTAKTITFGIGHDGYQKRINKTTYWAVRDL